MKTNLLLRTTLLATLIAAASFYSVSFAQTEATTDSARTIPFIAYWQKGDSYDFIITKIRRQWKDDNPIKNDSISYRANFTVLDSTETNYRIKWTYETNFDDANSSIPKELLPNIPEFKTIEVIYLTDENGAFEEIENWKDMASNMNKMLDLVIETAKSKHKPNPNTHDEQGTRFLEDMITKLKNIYTSKEGIERLAVKELQVFHFPMGAQFSTAEPISYEEELPNLLGGDPLKSNVTLKVEEWNEDDGFCVLTQQTHIDPEGITKMLTDLFKNSGLDEQSIKKALNVSVYDINDTNRYEYFYDPGIPYFIETHRTVVMNIDNQNGRREDILRIKLAE